MPSFVRYLYNRAYSNALNSGATPIIAQARANLRVSSPQSFLYLVIFLNIEGVGLLITEDNRIFLFGALVVFFFGNRMLIAFLLKKFKISAQKSKEEVERELEHYPSFYEYLYWTYQVLPIALLLLSVWWRFYR